MVGLVVVVTLGIIALTATAVTAGLALHEEIQTVEFESGRKGQQNFGLHKIKLIMR